MSLRSLLTLAVVLVGSPLFTRARAAFPEPACDPLPYEIYWNVAETDPPGINLTAYHIFPARYTQTGDGCSTPGCKTWTQGVFPTISASGEKVNGGVPQNADLSKHLELLARDVVQWIPDPDWSGNAVLDFEAWTTVWELNTGSGDWHSRRYPVYSLELERQKYPDLDDLEVYLRARAEFNASALNFFAETLKTLTNLRPKVITHSRSRLKLYHCSCTFEILTEFAKEFTCRY